LEEISYLDGKDDVETITKRLNLLYGCATVGAGSNAVTVHLVGYEISIRAVSNLRLWVFYLKHQERVNRVPISGGITL
jgi:hypothetical protein